MGRKHCGKRRNCWLRAISPLPTVFSKGLFPRGVKSVNVWEWVNLKSLQNDKFLDRIKLEVLAEEKSNIAKMRSSALDKVENIVGNGEKCW